VREKTQFAITTVKKKGTCKEGRRRDVDDESVRQGPKIFREVPWADGRGETPREGWCGWGGKPVESHLQVEKKGIASSGGKEVETSR